MAPMDVEKDKKEGVGEDAPKNGDNKKPEEEATTIVTTANLAADELEVIVHPLVLLSTVDHYNRVAKDTRKRVVGVLLGTTWRGRIDITNSFAVPFEEDLKNPLVWYLDHNYLESMFYMFKKINAKERIVGFYSTGPKIKENDLQIDEVFRRFSSAPVFVIIDVRPGVEGIPVTAYRSKEEVEGVSERGREGGRQRAEGKEIQRTFEHVPSSVGALEAEEVGVEHLLRDINDPSVSTLANQVKQKLVALAGLRDRLQEMHTYLMQVVEGKLPVNNLIVYNMQVGREEEGGKEELREGGREGGLDDKTVFNLLPNLNVNELVHGLLVKTNDMHFVIYLSSLIRAVVALHGVVQNKIDFQEMEEGGKEGGKEGGRDGGKEGRTEGGKTEEGKENGEKKGASGEKGKGGKK
ncbi:hypothetical protein NSK_005113 [Nannochloropsis salina CCMP1776]|uniref:MPN domain-containing protein n=1 Tax=Nannochloropsis salina CCMP1776 TaxID=1027361 RepID=A0A4D9D5V1_9STRA|nr:hypothetical protein NSK_005113 [Nannochloropsis salina CCMP1776]|eukprot:TFJ84018.1 hypothetical protein NSK_005113 [Nannochloropsis salina CCMP1776]